VDELGFCLKVPAGYQYKGVRNEGKQAWWLPTSAADPVIMVDLMKSTEINDLLDDEIGKNGKTGTKGDLPGGKWALIESGGTARCDVQIKGPKGAIGCGLSGTKDSVQKACEICKTVRAIK
jgi:hypothetical protein